MWQGQHELTDQYHLVSYDRRGFGETTCVDEPFSQTTDLLAVLDQFYLSLVILMGSSQGGKIAIDFALRFPARVSVLVLIAPALSGARSPGSFPPSIQTSLGTLDAADDQKDLPLVNAIETHLWLDGPNSFEGRVHGPLRQLFADMNGVALEHPELTQEIDAPPAAERLGQIHVPTLLFYGDLDLTHIQQRTQKMALTIPEATSICILGTAHMPGMEQPRRINAPAENSCSMPRSRKAAATVQRSLCPDLFTDAWSGRSFRMSC